MDNDKVFWIVFCMLAAIVVICGFHGCRKAMEEANRHDEAMAERGYEHIGSHWINRNGMKGDR